MGPACPFPCRSVLSGEGPGALPAFPSLVRVTPGLHPPSIMIMVHSRPPPDPVSRPRPLQTGFLASYALSMDSDRLSRPLWLPGWLSRPGCPSLFRFTSSPDPLRGRADPVGGRAASRGPPGAVCDTKEKSSLRALSDPSGTLVISQPTLGQ